MAAKSPKNFRAENQRLRSEVNHLRLRLEEAEQALEAIRTGQAESLIVEGPDGPRIFSLQGADHSYRVLVEAMNEGAATLGEDETILYCNARFAEMLDGALERVMGSAIRWFLPERSRSGFEALVREAGGGESRGELELLSLGGRVVPAYLSVSLIHDEGRRRLCLVAADLRAHKRSEQIMAAERLARSVLEQAAEAIVVCDEEGRVIRANSTATQLCGRNPLLGKFDEVFAIDLSVRRGSHPGPNKVRPTRLAVEVLRGEVLRAAPATLRRPDGSEANLLVSATSLRGTEGETIGCVVNLMDITELSRALRALEESEARFRAVLENSLDAAYRRDLLTGAFDYLSPAIQMVNGFSVQEMSSMSVEETLSRTHPDDLSSLRNALQEAERTGELKADYRFKDKDGQYRWLADRAVMMKDESGRARYRSGVVRDISESMRAEEALLEANLQLADAAHRKNEFLGQLSHELRNPLTPIRNSLYILERATPGGEQARRALKVIDRQSSQLARLIDDLLDITRISRGKIRLQRTRLDLVEVVRRTVEDHRAFVEHHEVVQELPNEAIPIEGDATRLAQAIGNLLVNAAKFTPENGKITVSLTRAQDCAVLEVADTGLGIDPDTLSRLFEPFAQAERSLDRSRGGLGLGLPLVKGMVELHGGEVSAHSEGSGQGARFTIKLPLCAEGTVGHASPQPEEPTAARRRVLVIEDNVDAACSLREALELRDHEVEIALSGPEGLEKARQFDPEFVLCALGLPGMDGFEVARAFRSDETLKDVHLVAVTGPALSEEVERAVGAGFERHLERPSSAEKIEELLAGIPRPPSAGGKSRSQT
jgi:PAS domain S-box-containing protein